MSAPEPSAQYDGGSKSARSLPPQIAATDTKEAKSSAPRKRGKGRSVCLARGVDPAPGVTDHRDNSKACPHFVSRAAKTSSSSQSASINCTTGGGSTSISCSGGSSDGQVSTTPFVLDDNVVYILFDLETTGLSRLNDRIVQLSALACSHQGQVCEKDEQGRITMGSLLGKQRRHNPGQPLTFDKYVNPGEVRVSRGAAAVHGITQQQLASAAKFEQVCQDFLTFVHQCTSNGTKTAVLAAHNGNAFDIPFLLLQMQMAGILVPHNWRYTIDTLQILKRLVKEGRFDTSGLDLTNTGRPSLGLSSVHKGLFGRDIDGAHDAMNDVRAMHRVMTHDSVWEGRHDVVCNMERHIDKIKEKQGIVVGIEGSDEKGRGGDVDQVAKMVADCTIAG